MKKIITILTVSIILFSCSKDDEPTPVSVPTNNYALKGLFKMNTSYSTNDDHFIFENGRVFWGNEAGSIHQTIAAGSTFYEESNTYTYDQNTKVVKFDYYGNHWEGTYEPTTGKMINGVVKSSNGLTVVGSFNGQKYIPEASGASLFKGYWKGFYGIGTQTVTTPFNLIIENATVSIISNSENSLLCNDNSYVGLSLSQPVITDKTITCIYQYVGGGTFSMEATYNPTTKKLEGSWGSGTNVSGGGTITFEAQNLE
jgi:hypothetical protein